MLLWGVHSEPGGKEVSPRLLLPRPTRQRIQKLDRRSRCPDQRIRCRVILKAAAGRSCNAAARELGCVPSTAVRIVARFRREGEASLMDHCSENGTRNGERPSERGFPRPTWILNCCSG